MGGPPPNPTPSSEHHTFQRALWWVYAQVCTCTGVLVWGQGSHSQIDPRCSDSLGRFLGILLAIPVIQAELLQDTSETGQTVSQSNPEEEALRAVRTFGQSSEETGNPGAQLSKRKGGTASRTASLTLCSPPTQAPGSSSGSMKG